MSHLDKKFNHHWSKRPDGWINPRERYEDPAVLEQAVIDYFEWCSTNHLEEEKVFATKNGIERAKVDRMRAPSIRALCLHLQMSTDEWRKWRELEPKWRNICQWAESVMYAMKLEAASVDMLNTLIVSRDLGLKDGHELSGPNGGPIETEVSAKDVLLARIARLTAAEEDDGGAGEPDGS